MTVPAGTDGSGAGPEARALLARLRRDGGVRRDLAALRTSFVETFPEYATDADRDKRLARLLVELEHAGEIARYKSGGGPVLPAGARLLETKSVDRTPGRQLPVLHRALDAARGERTGWTADEVAVLERLSNFLRDEPDVAVIARRERSFRLFGHEKRLDALRATRFGRLGLVDDALLRCVDTPPPFAWVRVAGPPRARLLIVENSATFDSLALVLEAHPDPAYDIVVWGGGRGIEKTLPFARRLPEHAAIAAIESMHYCGDLDPPGVKIASNAAALASELDLPPLRPAAELYAALVVADPAPYLADYAPYDAAGLAWLPPDVGRASAALHAERLRVPQEALDRTALERVLTG